jgi:hypothetical protein
VEFASIPREVRLLMRKAKAFQLNLSELAPRGPQSGRAAHHTRTFSRASVETGAGGFIEAARELGCDEDEAAFDEKLRKGRAYGEPAN